MREGKALSTMLCLCVSGATGKKSEERGKESACHCSTVVGGQDANADFPRFLSQACGGVKKGDCEACGRKNQN